jgi:hypothetical protein
MKISERTVKRLGEIITGDKGILPYRGGPKLVSFFNECGTNHNIKDFSHPAANNKLPHPDVAACFSRLRSMSFITLGQALRRVQPEQFADLMIEQEWMEEPRRLTEILDAIDLLFNQVWYNRHQVRREKIESDEIKLVENESSEDRRGPERTCQRDIWEGARKSARKLEKRYGLKNLSPWDDFEWGMINGKLSALRWVLGDEWDMLDT